MDTRAIQISKTEDTGIHFDINTNYTLILDRTVDTAGSKPAKHSGFGFFCSDSENCSHWIIRCISPTFSTYIKDSTEYYNGEDSRANN